MLSTIQVQSKPRTEETGDAENQVKMRTENLSVYYRQFKAITDVNLSMYAQKITAIIGPSGCGKSTLLRALNRMNDLVSGSHAEGQVYLDEQPLYGSDVDVVDVRRHIGMVFQRPNPFPKTIYDNVAYGPRLYGMRSKGELDGLVEKALRQAALWDEVKDKLNQSGLSTLRGPAAAPVHRPRDCGPAGSDPDGRTGLGARPDLDPAHRGADA